MSDSKNYDCSEMAVRKIIHVDMDAFYASVEQRDNAELRGKPVIVARLGNRSVVCAASYEARRSGVHSAMTAVRVQRLCPEAIFVPPDFVRYRAISLGSFRPSRLSDPARFSFVHGGRDGHPID